MVLLQTKLVLVYHPTEFPTGLRTSCCEISNGVCFFFFICEHSSCDLHPGVGFFVSLFTSQSQGFDALFAADSCADPGSVDNADRFVPGTSFLIVGSEVTYQCLPGFDLSGSNTIQCQSNLQWTTKPTCSGKKTKNAARMLKKFKLSGSHGTHVRATSFVHLPSKWHFLSCKKMER